jgi:hypothetical protein
VGTRLGPDILEMRISCLFQQSNHNTLVVQPVAYSLPVTNKPHARTHARTHAHARAHTHRQARAHTHPHTPHTHTRVPTRTHHTRVRIHMRTRTHTRARTRKQASKHAPTHARTHVRHQCRRSLKLCSGILVITFINRWRGRVFSFVRVALYLCTAGGICARCVVT